MYYDWIQENKKTIIVLTVLFFVGIIGWGTATYVSRIDKVGVTISAVPGDATVTINDKKVHSGTHWIKPGKYIILAQKDGFKTREKAVTAAFDKEKNVVALSLTPESDTAKKWAEANENAYKENEQFGSIEARANGEYFRKKHPITTVLPYTDPYYSLSYRVKADGNIAVTVTTPSPRYRYLAIEKLRELGYNPTDFKVQFDDFNNPLGEKNE